MVFGEIYNCFYGKVFYTCLGIVKDRDLACDLVQDTMIKVLKSYQHYNMNTCWAGGSIGLPKTSVLISCKNAARPTTSLWKIVLK
ncbi:MAG: hypothetical protein R2788_08020 [Saprospiraceae bacterium]